MRRRPKRQAREDYTGIAFVAAAMLGVATIAVVEDMRYSATGVPLWSTWHFQPFSIFAGTLAFIVLLYFLQRMNNRSRAFGYVEPYLPLLLLSGANLLLRLNAAWLLLVLIPCILWSVIRMRKSRMQRAGTFAGELSSRRSREERARS